MKFKSTQVITFLLPTAARRLVSVYMIFLAHLDMLRLTRLKPGAFTRIRTDFQPHILLPGFV